jgi:GNAT superfamily N-acetyltransferase
MRQAIRTSVALLPKSWRFALFRSMATCDPAPDPRLVLKIAETEAELEACFALLHDAYVSAGFMQPDPSGLRVTPYHALPTTTTLCAKFEGRVVGTVSLIRDGVFGFPMQSAFDLSAVRGRQGRIAEVSALAVHPDFRRTGGWILFPLIKFLYTYAERYFDTRHLVIAVNPDKIELYESLMFYERLPAADVAQYDFANGAPAVGAALDIERAKVQFQRTYAHLGPRRNLYRYFVESELPNIQWPARPYHTTNDPVLTPKLLDHFFNQRTGVFAAMDDRRRMLLRSIYDLSAYESVLPAVQQPEAVALRRHPRFTMLCPAEFVPSTRSDIASIAVRVTEISRHGFKAECQGKLPMGLAGRLRIELGKGRAAEVSAESVRQIDADGVRQFGFQVHQPDETWLECVHQLETGQTHADLVRRAAITPVGIGSSGDGAKSKPHTVEGLALQH